MTNIEPNLLITKEFTRQIGKKIAKLGSHKTDRVENITNILGSLIIKVVPIQYYDSELLVGKG